MGYVDQDVNEENENDIEHEMCPCYPIENDLLSIVIRSLRIVGVLGCMTHLSTIHGLELPSSVKSSLACFIKTTLWYNTIPVPSNIIVIVEFLSLSIFRRATSDIEISTFPSHSLHYTAFAHPSRIHATVAQSPTQQKSLPEIIHTSKPLIPYIPRLLRDRFQHVGRSMALSVGSFDKRCQPVSSSLLHHHVQRAGMVSLSLFTTCISCQVTLAFSYSAHSPHPASPIQC
jgi:hypothetical protein